MFSATYPGYVKRLAQQFLREPRFVSLSQTQVHNIIMYLSVIFSIVVSVGIFVVGPTALVNWLKSYISNSLMLNLIEGILRIIMFVAYIGIISRMQDIKKLFQYHSAEVNNIFSKLEIFFLKNLQSRLLTQLT